MKIEFQRLIWAHSIEWVWKRRQQRADVNYNSNRDKGSEADNYVMFLGGKRKIPLTSTRNTLKVKKMLLRTNNQKPKF